MSDVFIACALHSALENLRAALGEYGEKQGRVIGQKRSYLRFEQDFKDQAFSYHENLFNLLDLLLMGEAGETRQNLDRMAYQADAMEWKARKIDEKLKDNSIRSHTSIVENLEEMAGLVLQLIAEVQMGESFTGANDELQEEIIAGLTLETSISLNFEYCTNLFSQLRRQNSRHSFFLEFSTLNRRLQRYIPTRVRALTQESGQARPWNNLPRASSSKLRRQAKTLYPLLYNAWQCKCRQQHEANLMLTNSSDDTQFQIRFLFGGKSNRPSKPWTSEETIIRELDNNGAFSPLEAISSTPPKDIAKTTTVPRSILKSKSSGNHPSRRGLPSLKNLPINPRSLRSATVSWPDESQRHFACSKRTSIEPYSMNCLCAAFSAHTIEHTEFNFALKGSNLTFSVSPAGNNMATSTVPQRVSLDKVLIPEPGKGMSQRQCFSVAHSIAKSALELHSTPWLDRSWGKQDIVFFRSNFDSPMTFEKPYLVHKFGRQLAAMGTGDELSQVPQTREHVTESLGIMLLELCYGKPLEKLKLYAQYRATITQVNATFNVRFAKFLCDTYLGEDHGPEVQAAVEWCLSNCRASMSEEKWEKEFFKEVVTPFHNYVQFLNGKGLSGVTTNHYGNVSEGAVAFYGNTKFDGKVIVGGIHTHLAHSH